MSTFPLIGRLAAITGLAALTVLGAPLRTEAASPLMLFADKSIKVSGSDNAFCGVAHSNGNVRVTGTGNVVSGRLEYAGVYQGGSKNTLNPVKADQAPLPQPEHDLDYYRALARAQGTYFAGDADLDAISGVIFAEGDIHLSGSQLTGAVTFVSAHGEIHLSGSHNSLIPAVDDLLFYTATGNADINGSNSSYQGGMFAPAGSFARHGADDSNVTGPVVARTISWSGARNHLGGECCAEAADCPAAPCTTAVCTGGTCGQTPLPDCLSCTRASDCPTTDACTIPLCTPGQLCAEQSIPGCIRCSTAADCPTAGECATAVCAAGSCATARTPNCPAPAEVCGDCVDNDGDGLTDAEDSDCCAAPLAFGAKIVQLRPLTKRGDRLRLMGIFSPAMPAGFDPRTQDTSVQLTDEQGPVFCTTIPASHWMPMGKRSVSFWSKRGSYANGLSDGRFKVKRDGSVLFRTHGRRIKLRTPMARHIQITVRVGDRCSQTTTALRPTRTGLALP